MTRLRRRLPFLGLGVVSLLAGMWGGLVMLGWHIPVGRPTFPEDHGMLMVLGFLGTVIGLERAVALGRPWGYAVPGLAGLSALWMVAGLDSTVAAALLCAAGVVLLGVFAVAYHMQPAPHTLVMWAGAVAWVVAAALWLDGWDIALLVPWLAGFLILTIVGERLELSRMVRLQAGPRRLLLAVAGVFMAGLVISVFDSQLGVRIAGASLILQAAWLFRFDVARRTVRLPGLTRFIAAALLIGYGWLAVGGALWLRFGTLADGPAFDAMIHAIFLGFVMSMIFAHAPMIVPAVLGTEMRFGGSFYGHLALLHASLLLRLVGGDLAGNVVAWQWGGLLNVVAILLFITVTIIAVRSGMRDAARPAAGGRAVRSRAGAA